MKSSSGSDINIGEVLDDSLSSSWFEEDRRRERLEQEQGRSADRGPTFPTVVCSWWDNADKWGKLLRALSKKRRERVLKLIVECVILPWDPVHLRDPKSGGCPENNPRLGEQCDKVGRWSKGLLLLRTVRAAVTTMCFHVVCII